mmetsp:Transcript_18349/g.24215  ORF Transcript_18349/g.24215 Transcript_18349/m.24215 type:complete len:530 (+) Transcript_18349:77-1666(+)
MKPKENVHCNHSSGCFEDQSSSSVIFRAKLVRTSWKCPFSNASLNITVNSGECIWLRGDSGSGKTLTAMHLATIQKLKGVKSTIEWSETIPDAEGVGMLFQGAVLVDSLTVGENIALGLRSGHSHKKLGGKAETKEVKRLQTLVGLAEQDLRKMPGELSGGMLRRAALAQLLAQGKKLIILDEPFVGLDPDTAISVGKELLHIRETCGTAFILISHIKEYADLLKPDQVLTIKPAVHSERHHWWRLPHLHWFSRIVVKLWDYLIYSLPLIVLAFIAAGLAISMLFADVLGRTEVTDKILGVFDSEFEGVSIPGQSEMGSKMMLMMLRMKITQVINRYVPEVKEQLFAVGLTKLFSLEIGPLLTALLLAGRIGGSYAGEVGTMQATNQNRLLRTLGVSARAWTLIPTAFSALVAAPLLTLIGTATAIYSGSFTATWYSVAGYEQYWEHVESSLFHPDCQSWKVFPPYVLLYRSVGFICVVIIVAELVGRMSTSLQPRHVPLVITSSVVLSGLMIIFLDWAFSQVLLHSAC